jgi:hypothetical protein
VAVSEGPRHPCHEPDGLPGITALAQDCGRRVARGPNVQPHPDRDGKQQENDSEVWREGGGGLPDFGASYAAGRHPQNLEARRTEHLIARRRPGP